MFLMNKIIFIDYSFTNLLNKFIPHNVFFDYFFSFFSIIGTTTLIWIVLAILLIVFEEIKHKKFIIYFALSLITTSLLVNVVIKNIIRRPRPTMEISNFKFQISNCPADFSFPSGHAATAFAAAAILAYFDKKRRWFYYTVAILISYSRIYLGCHYFLDVISGALIGYIISRLLLFVHGTFPSRRKS
jgi:undecaprenyl-diphosphatase